MYYKQKIPTYFKPNTDNIPFQTGILPACNCTALRAELEYVKLVGRHARDATNSQGGLEYTESRLRKMMRKGNTAKNPLRNGHINFSTRRHMTWVSTPAAKLARAK